MLYRTLMALTLIPMLLSSSTLATQIPLDTSAELKEKLTKLDSMQASFSQRVTDINQREIQQGVGIIALSYPNKFYWHLTEPDESLIVADGVDVWLYNPFAEEVSVLSMNQAIEASPIALLVHRDEQTWQQYEVTKQASCFSLTAKNQEPEAYSIEICFEGELLTELKLTDQQGNLSHFTLSSQRALTSDESELFKFSIPEDVDIDDQRLNKP